VQGQVKSKGMAVFYAFFGMILGIGVVNIVCTVLFGFFKIQFARYFNHISWFLLAIFIIITFILGSLFAIFGVLGSDLSTSFNYLFTSAQITKVFKNNGDASSLLDVCINQDGDIANKVFKLSTTNVNSINTLTTANNQLNDLKANLTANSKSITVPKINSAYQGFYDDITTVTNSNLNLAPAKVFTEWNRWSDSAATSSLVGSCTNPPKERWVQNKTLCPSGYSYFSKASASSPGAQGCLSMQDWDSSVIQFIYLVCSIEIQCLLSLPIK
jgi:hypothetical protein